jgi:cation diffusion facilitator CzcD-associated flavoprotein CzcO
MAKTYLDVYPDSQIVILDSADSMGGTWSSDRLYPGLHSNNLVGSYEYSDFPLDRAGLDVKTGEHIPGPKLHQYLEAFATKFDLTRRAKLGVTVTSVERTPLNEWDVTFKPRAGLTDTVRARKLVIATGLTNNPFVPTFPGQETFQAPVFHVRYLKDQAEQLMASAKNVVILGGSKSAYDAAYAFASQGISVDWIIRESGHGTNWMAPPYVTPLKKRLEGLVGVRFLTWFSPCIWGDQDGYAWVRRLLHGTRIGRFFVDTFWNILTSDVTEATGYDKHKETAKLKPKLPAFWHASSLSILNYPSDFYEYVRNGTIKVHTADIDHLSPRTVHLADGSTVSGDALICSTGWQHRPAIDFLPSGIDAELGMPHNSTEPESEMVAHADQEILTRFPRLANQPEVNKKYKPLPSANGGEPATDDGRPFRLYRFMVPPASINEPSIAFLGILLTIHTLPVAQAQALWVTAYLNHRLPAQQQAQTFDPDGVAYETILQTEFGKWRYPAAFGKKFPDFVFDAVPYMDMLLRDLDLKHRRKNGWWAEIFHPYGPEDYRGLVDEWRIKVGCAL